MKIFVIVLNYNGSQLTLNCLKSLSLIKATGYLISTIVVDNASRDNSVNLVNNQFPKIKIIKNNENLGFAEGNNIGIRYALNNEADYILLLNNDTIVDNNLVDGLLKAFSENEKAGIISPKIYFAPGYEFHFNRYQKTDLGRIIWYAGGIIDWKNVLGSHRGVDEVDNGQYQKIVETDFATGCCMLIKREVFKKIGLLDKRYFLYFEDTDFCQRAKLAGYKIVYSPYSFLWHLNAGSAGGSGSKLQDYYIVRNRLLFTLKYASFKSKIAVFKEAIREIFTKNDVKKAAVSDFFLNKFGQRR